MICKLLNDTKKGDLRGLDILIKNTSMGESQRLNVDVVPSTGALRAGAQNTGAN